MLYRYTLPVCVTTYALLLLSELIIIINYMNYKLYSEKGSICICIKKQHKRSTSKLCVEGLIVKEQLIMQKYTKTKICCIKAKRNTLK